MAINAPNILHKNNWQDEVYKAITGGLFREQYKILVLVTRESMISRNGTANTCAALFQRYGLIEETQCDRYWLLEYLSAGKEKVLYDLVVNGVIARKRIQVITDIHQYFYSTERTTSVLWNIVKELEKCRTGVPVVFLANAQSAKWLYQTISTDSVLYIEDGSSVRYNTLEDDEAVSEYGNRGEKRNGGLEKYAEANNASPPFQKKVTDIQYRKSSEQKRTWYFEYPDWLRFETERVRKGCAGLANENLQFYEDPRYAYWVFTYRLNNIICKVHALYHAGFPNADPDNIMLVPIEPKFEDFKRLHGSLLDYKYNEELKRHVISIQVEQNELQGKSGYAEVAWQKLYSKLNGNNYNGEKRNSGSLLGKAWSFLSDISIW